MFSSVFPRSGTDSSDGRLWRDTILAAVDTVGHEAVKIEPTVDDELSNRCSRVSDQIRVYSERVSSRV